tara:strand:- start:50310 stop:51248 length:939 start_codon:yes stop_codon:yes gene_type:complete
MKAIMYHYVRPFNKEYPFLKNLDLYDFKKQLDYFEKKYGIINREEFLFYFKNGDVKNIKKGIVLTFDDGLSCHYDYVFPELKKRNLWGIFYVSTLPLVKKKLLDVHRTHVILGKNNSKEVYNYLKKIITEDMFDKEKFEEFKKFTYSNQINDNYSLLVKRITNYYLSHKHREKILDKLVKKFIKGKEEIIKNYYLNNSQIKEMHEDGMTIGSHTVNHQVMSRLKYLDQKYEIEESFNQIKNIIGEFNPKTFCYPYGGFHSFTNETEKILIKNKSMFSFNVEQRDIKIDDIINRPQALPRYDCNKFKHGKVRS